ncbi:hypothetical protein [Chitinophaga qingshengii]|uniref:Uncharacterized protein n=1 Tax=Chitinophaga qingshengii TaxID=1569794 RepID=A0ABR7TGF7_9BACT|nr:hypothetical protein [Chitinophaga qingshengii]MBC9929541.1 hypothetical protein [Chitinophaga qingshengii]
MQEGKDVDLFVRHWYLLLPVAWLTDTLLLWLCIVITVPLAEHLTNWFKAHPGRQSVVTGPSRSTHVGKKLPGSRLSV